jgi:hypothetical protein
MLRLALKVWHLLQVIHGAAFFVQPHDNFHSRLATIVTNQTNHPEAHGSSNRELQPEGGHQPHITSPEELHELLPPKGKIEETHPIAAKHVAISFFAVMVGLPVAFAMTQTKVPHVPLYTFLAMEQIVAVFVAVLIFQAVDDVADMLLTSKYIHVDVHEHHSLIIAVHSVCWLIIAALIAFALPKFGPKGSKALPIFCGLGGHIMSFFAVHSVITGQEHHFSHSIAWCIAGFFLILVISALLMVASFVSKRVVLGTYPSSSNLTEEEAEWVENADTIEDDFIAMALATWLTLLIRFMILGRYPHFGGLVPGEQPLHSVWHRGLLLVYLIVLLAISAASLPFLKRKENAADSYLPRRLVYFTRAFLSTSIAWAFLLWGHWEIHERHFHWDPMMARLLFSGLCTGLLFVVIWIIALTGNRHLHHFSVYTVSLITGYTWEESFNHSLDVVLEGKTSLYLWKMLMAVIVSLVLIPVWAVYLKPLTMEMIEAHESKFKEEISESLKEEESRAKVP